jgi:beta-1,4-mannosyl-glycoprotein beta-1,4-N-acetylglucosaminyltransferase
VRIWDTFLFYNELDMLECRLTELEDAPIYKHVIVESTFTFQGRSKPLHFQANRERFAKWKDKIVYVVLNEIMPDDTSPWDREIRQREVINVGLEGYRVQPDDIIMLSDVDEIPRPEMINEKMQTGVTYTMRQHMFAANWLHPDTWQGTAVQTYGLLESLQHLRNERESSWPKIPDAGWHLSFFGGHAAVRDKVAAYSHPELMKPMRAWLSDGRVDRGLALPSNANGMKVPAPYGIPELDSILCKQQMYMPIDDSYPKWIREGRCPRSWLREEVEEEIQEKERTS